MRIERCVCTNQSFACLLKQAKAEGSACSEDEASGSEGWSLDQIAEATGAGAQCGRCRPYLAVGLKTGQTVFTELLPPMFPSASQAKPKKKPA